MPDAPDNPLDGPAGRGPDPEAAAAAVPIPPAVMGSGTSLWRGIVLLVAYLVLQVFVMFLLAVVDLALGGGRITDAAAHMQQEMGWMFATATLLVTPLVFLLAWQQVRTAAFGLVPTPEQRRRAVRRHLGLVPAPWRGTLLWLAVTAAVLVVYEVAARLLERPPMPDFMVEFYATSSPWMLALAVIVGAPLVEEVIFRGFMLPGLAHGRVGGTGAVLITALLWALIHGQYDLFDMAAVFSLGLVFGASRLHTGSLWPPLLLHAAVNALAMVQIHLALG